MCELKDASTIVFKGREGLRKIVICTGTGCIANGAMEVYHEFVKEMTAAGFEIVEMFKNLDKIKTPSKAIYLSQSGCQGFCQMGPLVKILPDDILYNLVKVADVKVIVEKTLKAGEIIETLFYVNPVDQKRCRSQKDIPFYQRQTRFVLKQCGDLNPEDIQEYIAIGGYEAARTCYTELSPEAIDALIATLHDAAFNDRASPPMSAGWTLRARAPAGITCRLSTATARPA